SLRFACLGLATLRTGLLAGLGFALLALAVLTALLAFAGLGLRRLTGVLALALLAFAFLAAVLGLTLLGLAALVSDLAAGLVQNGLGGVARVGLRIGPGSLAAGIGFGLGPVVTLLPDHAIQLLDELLQADALFALAGGAVVRPQQCKDFAQVVGD